MKDLTRLSGLAFDGKAILVTHHLLGDDIDPDTDLVALVIQMPKQTPYAYGVATKVPAIGVERGAQAVGRSVEFVDDGNAETLTESLPDIRPHAIAPSHLHIVLLIQSTWRGIDEVAAELADILYDVCVGLAYFGPEGLVGEFAGENDGGSSVDTWRDKKPMGSAVVEWHCGVHAVAWFKFQVGSDVAAGVEFPPCEHDGGFGKACGARGVNEVTNRIRANAGAAELRKRRCVGQRGYESR